MLMANLNPKPRVAVSVSAAQLSALADQLSEWAQSLKRIAETAESQANGEIAVFNWQSLPKGLSLISSFVTRAQESRRQVLMGNPWVAGQFMPTSRAAKQTAVDTEEETKDVADSMAAEIEGRLGKATPKPPAATKKQTKRKAE
jgi:hypothetical protein